MATGGGGANRGSDSVLGPWHMTQVLHPSFWYQKLALVTGLGLFKNLGFPPRQFALESQ